jgi:hypothetical protein
MDLRLVREEAIEETARFFWHNRGVVPDQDSEEWEAEYRHQFELAKGRQAGGNLATPASGSAGATAAEPGTLAELTGAPTQIRWAATLRAERMREIRDPGVREWLATTWTKAKSWIDTQELSTQVFMQRITPHYQEYRKKADEQARIRAHQRSAQEAEADEIRRQVENAGITVAGLIELIDVCDRLPAMPLKVKIAELTLDGRNLRIFETDDPALLMVLEKDATSRGEFAIERDGGLVADLMLFSRSMALS